jgi:hypothetical protein
MIRKLVQHGPSTLITSLPSKWIKKNNLTSGNEIIINEVGNDIIISTSLKQIEKQSINVQLESETETYIRMVLINAYRSGCDILNVKFSTKSQFKTIQSIIDNYILGFEITSYTENSCVIENLTSPTEDKLDVILRRIFLLVKESLTLLEKDFVDKKINNFSEFLKMTYKIGQYDNFCKRNFSKKIFEREEAHFIWVLSNYLLQAQHSLKHLYDRLNLNGIISSQNIIDYITKAKNLLELLYLGYFEKDSKKIAVLNDIYSELQYSLGHNLILNEKDKITAHYLNEFVRNIYSASSPVLATIIHN